MAYPKRSFGDTVPAGPAPASHSPDFIRWVAKTYRDDFNGYRRDILGMKGAEWQDKVGLSLMAHKRTAVSSGHGIGKAHPVSMMLHTPDGLRRWGDLRRGNRLFGSDGKSTRILQIYEQGELPIFEVRFDDGSSTRTSAEHLWLVRGRNDRRTGGSWRVLSTAEILAAGVTRSNGVSRAKQWEIPVQGAVEFLPVFGVRKKQIAAYTLGVWLGDGGRNKGEFTGIDQEVVDRLRIIGENVRARGGGSQSWGITGLKVKLRELGILDRYSYQKSVPAAYLEASAFDRAELLRGLLDTDGECNAAGSIIFNSTSMALVEDVIWLARSLGGKARMQPTVKMPFYRSPEGERLEGRPCWRATLSMPEGFRSFYIERKQSRVKAVQPRYLSRWIASITQVGVEECSCVTVQAEDSLYLANDFIVTHNTAFGASAIHWFISTRPHPAIVATANTEAQLTGKLWRELAKVNNRAKNKDWFDWKQKSFTMFQDPTAQAVALAWSEDNPEAFAGTHEDHVLGVFDEGSAIARSIFNVFAGAMTTAGARWLLLGNPTRNEGYFFDATHGKLKARRQGDLAQGMWNSFVVPSSASPFVEAAWVEEMKASLGEESDEYRIRVLGLPPRTDVQQFFNRDIVMAAMGRNVPMFGRWPLILGCDVGRGDRSVMVPRRGRVVLPKIEVIQGSRTTDFARRIADEIRFYREDQGLEAQVILEELGMGVGVVETLEDMGYADHVWGINTGNSASEPDLYLNLRCEMYALLKDWLEDNVELPNVPALVDDMVTIQKKSSGVGKLRLETKEEMRRRSVPSPDVADALALTFAVPFDLLPEKQDAWEAAARRQSSRESTTWMSN